MVVVGSAVLGYLDGYIGILAGNLPLLYENSQLSVGT